MKILSIECSSLSASAAITDEKKLIGESFVNVGLNHSRTLMPAVNGLLENTETDIKDIDVFAVTAGPGSFTGVRIGVAAVKGLAFTQNKPCFSVSATEAIAYPFRKFDGVVCPVMDARCGQVYTALFENGKRLCPDEAMLTSELCEKMQALGKKIILAGDGAEMCFGSLSCKVKNLYIADSQFRFARASSVCFIAKEKIENGENTVDGSSLLPVYLRLPQAQRELNNKSNIKKLKENTQ